MNDYLFVGYFDFDIWLRSIIHENPVYVAITMMPVTTTYPDVVQHQVAVFAGQPEPGQNLVHYFRLYVGDMKIVGGHCVTPGVMLSAEKVYKSLIEHLEKLLIVTVNGVIATPPGILLQNGDKGTVSAETP
ncbi:MAG: hypothetical protein ACOYYS_10075 [Chloroflexota bacterium]